MKQGEKQFLEQQAANAAAQAQATSAGSDFWLRFVPATMYDLKQLSDKIDMKLKDLAAGIQAAVDRQTQDTAAIKTAMTAQQAAIDDLKAKLDDVDTTPEVDAAVANLQTATDALDAVVPK
jgi:hypothetical protein